MNITVDLMQLRWQLIRAIEHTQHVELDNVNLRKRITELEKPKGNLMQTSIKAITDLEEQIKSLKTQRAELKAVVSLEVQENAKFQSRIRQLLEKFAFIWSAKEIDWTKIKEDNKHLKITMVDLKEQLTAANQLRIREADRVKIKFDELKHEMVQLEQAKLSMTREHIEMKMKYDEMVAIQSNMGVNVEAMNAEIKRLKTLAQDVDGKYRKLSIETKENEQQIIDYYEHLLMQMYGENQELNMVINELKDQVQRLATAMLGNKSHFAKFVELKAENLDLQTKLKKISKKISTETPTLGVPLSNGSNKVHAAIGGTGSGTKPDHLLLYQQRIFDEHHRNSSDSEVRAQPPGSGNEKLNHDRGGMGDVAINGRVRSYRPSSINFTMGVASNDSRASDSIATVTIPIVKQTSSLEAEADTSNIVSTALKGKSLRYSPHQQTAEGKVSPRSIQNSPRIVPSIDITYQTDMQCPTTDDGENDLKSVIVTGVKAVPGNIANTSERTPTLSVGPIQLGVPLMSKQLRDSLKDRVIV